MKEEIKPEMFELPLNDPVPSFKNVIRLERYREKGCEVHYAMPKWLEEEKKTGSNFLDFLEKKHFDEYLKDLTKEKTKKKVLSKQYNFIKKNK